MAVNVVQAYIGDTSYTLSGGGALGDGTISLARHVGLGLPPVNRFRVSGPNQDGAQDVGFKLEPRPFMLSWLVRGTSYANMEDALESLIAIVQPFNTAIKFTFTQSGGALRSIYAHYVGGFPLESDARDGFARLLNVEFSAADPIFFDPVQQLTTLQVVAGDGLEIPLEIPFGVGAESTLSASLTYTGTWREYPIIRLYGPITDPVLTNSTYDATTGHTTTREIGFSGVTIANGDWYELDLRADRKSAVDNNGVSKMAYLTSTSSIATFRLEPDPLADGGTNSLTLTGSATGANTRILVYWYKRYAGIGL